MCTPQPYRPAPRLHVAVAVIPLIAAACAPAATGGSSAPASGQIVTAEDLERYPNEPIEKILERKVPGIEAVRTSSGGLALRVRGVSAWDGSERPPLYVLNGVTVASGPEGAVPHISVQDIETIKVLRGPETAIYGLEGANGVIIITTKRGPSQ